MAQGLGILFRPNNVIYSWLLWIAASILVIGTLSIAITASGKINKGAHELETA